MLGYRKVRAQPFDFSRPEKNPKRNANVAVKARPNRRSRWWRACAGSARAFPTGVDFLTLCCVTL
jgi:hypothetical protein